MSDEETEIGQDFDRVLRASLMAAMQVREAAQRRAQQSQQLQQQEAQQRQAREIRVAEAMNKDIHRTSFWNEATNERLANTYSVVAHLSAHGHPEAQSAHAAMTDRLRTRFGININDLNRDHPDVPAKLHEALIAALDDVRQNQVDLAEEAEAESVTEESAPALETAHLWQANEAAAEIETDEAHADLNRSQSTNRALAEAAARAVSSDVTDKAPKPMRDAAMSYRTSANAQLNARPAPAGARAKANRDLVPAQKDIARAR